MDIKNILDAFDNKERKDFFEYQISGELNQLKPKEGEAISPDLQNEIVAFDLAEMPSERPSTWGTYFGPKMQHGDGEGNLYEYPSINHINAESIEYWKKRAATATNPIMRARYRALILDFEKLITGNNPSFDLFPLYVNDLLDIVNHGYTDNRNNIFSKLKRALYVALRINSADLIKKCKDTILNLKIDEKYRNDFKFEFCFDNLIGNKKIALTDDEEKMIISELERKLIKTTSETKEKIDPWVAEQCATRLAKYYRKQAKEEEVKRVLRLVGKAYQVIIPEASGMQIGNWLESLHKLYLSFQLHADAEEVLVQIRANGEKAAKEMGAVPFDFEISGDEMKKYVDEMLTGKIEEVLQRLSQQYIPTKEYAKEQIKEISKVAPTLYIIGQTIQDSKGRTIAKIGPLEKDLDGHIIIQIAQTLLFSSVFLRQVLQSGADKNIISSASILSFLKPSPIINQERMEIIKKGLDAFYANDYLTAIHLLIPQIEESIRNIVEKLGGNVLKPTKSGTGFHLKTLDELLRDDLLIGLLGENLSNYLKILLTDQRGWNLRNNVCHGMANIGTFNSTNADRLVHVLICLGLISSGPKK